MDYSLWDRLGAVWLVTGQLEGAGDGYVLVVELHDVVYGELKERGRFRVPDAADGDFRMAVHRASDEIVRWATGDPGMAASRIAFTITDADLNKDVYLIDSDGENLHKVTDNGSLLESPTWSPDGSKIAYTSWKSGVPRIYELTLATGREKMLAPVRGEGDYITPAYSPDGKTLAFSVLGSNERSGIYTYDVQRDCCLAYLSGGPWYDFSPTFSPDGRWMAFNTQRFGDAVPQVMIMPAQGGPAETLSPYEYGNGGYFTSPDWSPVGDLVAFHGRIERGRYHILVANLADNGRVIRQLTSEGNNEDPSWAPDGRHLVFVGERSWGYGLFVVDASTGRLQHASDGPPRGGSGLVSGARSELMARRRRRARLETAERYDRSMRKTLRRRSGFHICHKGLFSQGKGVSFVAAFLGGSVGRRVASTVRSTREPG